MRGSAPPLTADHVNTDVHHLCALSRRHEHLPVAPWEAALGAAVTVPTLGGKVDLRIPPGSQSGSRLRLRGRGLPGSPPGDQFAVLEIVTPKANTDRTRALYEQMKREMGFDPRAGLGG